MLVKIIKYDTHFRLAVPAYLYILVYITILALAKLGSNILNAGPLMNTKSDNVNGFTVKAGGYLMLLCWWLLLQGCYSNHLIDFNTNYKKKIGILPVQNISNVKVGDVLQNLFSKSSFANNIISKCPNTLVIDGSATGCPDFLISPPVNKFGRVDNSKLVELGREAGLAGIVYQSIQGIDTYNRNRFFLWFKKNEYFFKIRLTATVLDVITGTILCKYTEEIDKIIVDKSNSNVFLPDNYINLTAECFSKTFLNMSSRLGSIIGKTLSNRGWLTTFTSVSGVNANIPVGREVGISSGDVFSVFSVEHAISGLGGEVYWVPGRNRVGKFTVISTYDDYSRGIFEGKDRMPKVNDIVVPFDD